MKIISSNFNIRDCLFVVICTLIIDFFVFLVFVLLIIIYCLRTLTQNINHNFHFFPTLIRVDSASSMIHAGLSTIDSMPHKYLVGETSRVPSLESLACTLDLRVREMLCRYAFHCGAQHLIFSRLENFFLRLGRHYRALERHPRPWEHMHGLCRNAGGCIESLRWSRCCCWGQRCIFRFNCGRLFLF